MDNNSELRVAGIVNDSIVDGPGIRLAVFVQGCPRSCEGCHNPLTHSFAGGKIMSVGKIMDMIKANPLLDGVTFSGGEPFCQAHALAYLGEMVRKTGLNVITYTGYEYEYLIENADSENGFMELIRVSDYIIDGEFIAAQRDISLKFRGSANQRIINAGLSLETGSAVTVEF